LQHLVAEVEKQTAHVKPKATKAKSSKSSKSSSKNQRPRRS
jgi:hypothetical protein